MLVIKEMKELMTKTPRMYNKFPFIVIGTGDRIVSAKLDVENEVFIIDTGNPPAEEVNA